MKKYYCKFELLVFNFTLFNNLYFFVNIHTAIIFFDDKLFAYSLLIQVVLYLKKVNLEFNYFRYKIFFFKGTGTC